MGGALATLLAIPAAALNTIYLANDNHTDYGWNATTDAYEASMLSELDFYLGRIDATAADPPDEQARFAADCWYYLWLYEHHRSPAQFQSLLDAIESGHITVPLNPFVTLYGALPTEAAIRAGYYPGSVERRSPIHFSLAQQMEDQTIPWGIASLWAASGVKYSWKGICACATSAPYGQHQTDAFRWQGPDGRDLLMKWYQFADNGSDSRSWGGYAEARDTLSSQAMQSAIDRFSARGQTALGLFGYGWDDVNSQTDAIVDFVRSWNDTHAGGPRAVVSNIVDYFQDIGAQRDALPALRGGWGNDWDLWPATLADRTAGLRRAVEQLRTAEALAAVAYADGDTALWDAHRDALADAWLDYFKYFEHGWGNGGVGLAYVIGNKTTWQAHFVSTVAAFDAAASAAFAAGFTTPDEDRFVVFNPLAFPRTDYADLPVQGAGPYVVTDVATGVAVPSQVVERDGARWLRVLARDVPSLGYRVYRYAPGAAGAGGCCAVDAAQRRIESDRWRVTAGAQGQLTSILDKATGNQELAGAGGLNTFDGGGGGDATVQAENVGPVSATLRVDLAGTPPRRVRVTLVREVDRIEIEDEILANVTSTSHYGFAVNLVAPQIHFEEVGAVARPGLAGQGGDFLPGTRADYMTLNHFLDLADELGDYHVTLSSRDAFAVRIGGSTPTSFDLPTSNVSILALGNVAFGDIANQGGATSFRHDFAVEGAPGSFSAAAAKRMGLAHQDPLRAIALPRQQAGKGRAATASYVGVDAPDVVVTAVKPAEDGGRGVLVRLWELDGRDAEVALDVGALRATAAHESSLIETDVGAVPLDGGILHAHIAANQIEAFRVDVGGPLPSATPSATDAPSSTATRSASPTATPTSTPTRTTTATRSPSVTPTATQSRTPPATLTPSATRTQTATPLFTQIPGDVDGDGHLTNDDLAAVTAAVFDPDPPAIADVNADGRVTVADLPALLHSLPPLR